MILRLQLGADKQTHAANIAEQIEPRVNALKVLNKQLALRGDAVQHFRRINQIEGRSADRAGQGVTTVG